MMRSLLNRTDIVTGAAGKGMGRSIALTLAPEGVKVVVNYRASADSAQAIANHITGQGGRAAAFQADVTRQNECGELVDFAARQYGPVGICIIVPGAGWHPEPIDKIGRAHV